MYLRKIGIAHFTQVDYNANNMAQDQTAPLGAVWSGFILFASMSKFANSVGPYTTFV